MTDTTPFKVSARTILHLGSELISSDAIAFYELIKNAFDAGSPQIEVDIKIRIRQDVVEIVRDLLADALRKPETDPSVIVGIAEWLLEGLVADAPDAAVWRKEIENAKSYADLATIVDDANEIVIADKGHGMSVDDLKDVYMTIGTSLRSSQRQFVQTSSARPILGEKGVGRLSVMRLGDKISVRTAKTGEGYWNLLEIDWRRFTQDSGALIEDVKFSPIVDKKNRKVGEDQGTTIIVGALRSVWTETILQDQVGREVSRMMDPFAKQAAFPVRLRFSGKTIDIKRLDEVLFAHANMRFTARFSRGTDDSLYMEGDLVVHHKSVDRQERVSMDMQTLKNVIIDPIRLSSSEARTAQNSAEDEYAAKSLKDLGPFSMTLYWFDRQKVSSVDGIGTRTEVRRLINQWAGGLMVFRDGFRVGRYGGHDDDWLDLDRVALSRSGYKLNRAQIIGKVDIDSTNNRELIDQTNREGLKDNKEKDALRKLLKWMITTYLYQKMENWEKVATSSEPEKIVEKKIEAAKRSLERAVSAAKRLGNDASKGVAVTEEMDAALAEVQEVLPQVSRFVERAAKDRGDFVHLAGIGLLLEIIAHELTRSVTNSLKGIQKARKAATGALARSLMVLEAGLRTIDKRLRLLDPLSTSGRQHKEPFDVIEWVKLIAESHDEQMQQNDIQLVVRVRGRAKVWPVSMVKGMFVQILENLLNNSFYWLKRVNKRKVGKDFRPTIDIELSPDNRTVQITDNGPGIAEASAEDVFNAFYSERPPGESHGLGLYISREIAHYNDADLTLSGEPVIHPGRRNSFILTLPEV